MKTILVPHNPALGYLTLSEKPQFMNLSYRATFPAERGDYHEFFFQFSGKLLKTVKEKCARGQPGGIGALDSIIALPYWDRNKFAIFSYK